MRVIVAGGGTAGHINPGLAIAREILKNKPDTEIIFVGTERGLEKDLVPKAGFELKLINVKGFRRKLSLDTLVSMKELLKGMFQARKVIKTFKPDIVIGTGGYVCGPVLMNASLMGIPTLIHEQNAFAGITNKLLSRFVDTICISFEESRKYFKKGNVILTGNPIREEILLADREECRKKLNVKDNEKVLLVYGGSGGADKINSTVLDYIKRGIDKNIRLIFATGSKQYQGVMEQLKGVNITENINITPYIYNMHEIMPASDLMVGRAGAISLSEITILGLPAVLIPSPNVTDNHQEYNARALQKAGAAEMLIEKDLVNINFKEYIEKILKDDAKIMQMAKKSREMGKSDSANVIYKCAMKLVKA